MNVEKRVEVFIHIREKIDEIFEIIKANKLEQDFMATYCFGLVCDEGKDESSASYEFIAGHSVDEPEELNMMFNLVAHNFATQDDDDSLPTDSIEYWLKK